MNETFTQLYRDMLIEGHVIKHVKEKDGMYYFDVYPAPKIILADKWTSLIPDTKDLWLEPPKRVRHYMLSPNGPMHQCTGSKKRKTMTDATQSLANMTKEQILEQNIKVFMRLYKDVLIKRCSIKIQEIRDDGTYVLVTYGHPAFERDKRHFVSPNISSLFSNPMGSYLT